MSRIPLRGGIKLACFVVSVAELFDEVLKGIAHNIVSHAAIETRVSVTYSGSMADAELPKSIPNSWLHKLFAAFSLGWLVHLVELVHALYRYAIDGQHIGMYEILDYDATLELLDNKGTSAIFRKRQKVKFLQDNNIAFEDYAWGDGKTIDDYKCSPGVVVDKYREGDRWNILISLRETKHRGDVVEFYIERRVMNGFTQAEEWQQAEIRRHTNRLQMAVIFPDTRPCRGATVLQRSRNRVLTLGADHFRWLPDGRQIVTWETNQVKAFDVYTLKWVW